jgi:predicted nucleotidyltransferase
MTDLAQDYFSPVSTVYHYLHMAEGNYKEYLKLDMVKIKKYFYVLRPLLACCWVEKNKTFPPMEFAKLLLDTNVAPALRAPIDELLTKKRAGVELGLEPKITILNEYIEHLIEHFNKTVQSFDPNDKPDAGKLDRAFADLIK